MYDALRDVALDGVMTSFISFTDANEIMRILEMRFGHPKYVAESILTQLRKLPNLREDVGKLIEFATKFENAIAAMKSIRSCEGYLYNPELVDRILGKLPSSIVRNYVHFRPLCRENKPELEKISDFLMYEAKLNFEAGILSSQPIKSNSKRSLPERSKEQSRHRNLNDRLDLVAHGSEFGEVPSKRHKPSHHCLYCKRNNHDLPSCNKFLKEKIN